MKNQKTQKIKIPKSGIVYSGPSLIDGNPIVMIAIRQSKNSKTGNMVQTYIIRPDVDPITANRTGRDYSICGNCKHRGTAQTIDTGKGLANGRTCYVNIGQGVMQVWKAYTKGKYQVLTAQQMASMVHNRMVRLGTYGDAAAVPYIAFKPLLDSAVGHTGYTHQLGVVDNAAMRRFMVSADSKPEAIKAHALGYRTFRVIPIAQANDPLLKNEIVCPSNRGIQCADCRLCNGADSVGKSIAIIAHGPTANKFN